MKDQSAPPDTETKKSLKAAALDAPRLPGVYLWKNADGQIIYVGKAKSLRDRLGSYFSGGKDIKTAALVSRAKSIETIIVANDRHCAPPMREIDE